MAPVSIGRLARRGVALLKMPANTGDSSSISTEIYAVRDSLLHERIGRKMIRANQQATLRTKDNQCLDASA
jgi:hypothetical protein